MTASTSLLDSLTDEQLDAVRAEDEIVHVQAGPGAGKTRVIAARVARLIESGQDAEQIVVVTFTRAACAEIRERIADQVGPVAGEVLIETFHGAAVALTELERYEPREIASDEVNDAAIRSLYKGARRRTGRDIPSIERLRKAIAEYEACGGEGPSNAFAAVGIVLARLRESDLLPMWQLLPRILKRGPARRFAHVLVDEGQDCTPSECRFAATLARMGGCLFVVSDMRQAIMGWRGAVPSWPRPTHQLARTFRFGDYIARTANALEVGPPIHGANLSSEIWKEVSLSAIRQALNANRPGATTAILTRTHADAEAIEQLFPERVRHVPRDAAGDPLASPADRAAFVAAGGHVPALTVHSAKGLEWDEVIVLGPSTIRWGRAAADPEELRVLFVAMTRARRRLVLVGGLPDVPGWRVRADGLAGGEA